KEPEPWALIRRSGGRSSSVCAVDRAYLWIGLRMMGRLVPVMRFQDQPDDGMGEGQAEQAPIGEGGRHIAQAIGAARLSRSSMLQKPCGGDARHKDDAALRREMRQASGYEGGQGHAEHPGGADGVDGGGRNA